MKNILINKRNTFAIVAGILFTGLLVKTIDEYLPVNLVQKDHAGYFNNENDTTLNNSEVILEENTIKETVVAVEDSVNKQKTENIRKYLSNRNSPLAEYAEEFVKAADEYGIDYRLVAAISIIESSGGQKCFRPYNAWGWGKMTFDNFTDGIWTVSKGLGKYYANGLNTPQLIAPRYCPPNAVKWASNVQLVMNMIGIN